MVVLVRAVAGLQKARGAFPPRFSAFIRNTTAHERTLRNMGTVILNDVVRIAARMKYADVDDIVNVYHYKLTSTTAGPGDSVAMNALADQLEDIYTPILGLMTTDTKFEDITFYNVTQDRPMGVLAWPTLTQGSGTGDGLPPGCAALITSYTATKRTYGRKFFGVIEETEQADGILTSAAQTSLATAAAELLDLVVVAAISTFTPGTYRPDTGTFAPFIEAVVRAAIAYQRRRKAGVGS